MKTFYIIILWLFVVISCNVTEKVTVTSFDAPQKDSIKEIVNLKELKSNTHKKVLIESNDLWSGIGNANMNSPNSSLKIIEIKNTRVIKQSTDLSEGRIVYKIPNIMKVRSTYKVLVRISKSKIVISLCDSLSGEVRTSKIPITETMEVKLIDISPKDDKAFEIVDGNSAVQMIENGDTYTEWSWDVTPVKVGNSKLKVVVSIIRDDNKKDIVYEDSVDVERDWSVQVSFFFKKYWQVLMTSIAIPFIVFAYKRRKSKKENENEENV